MKIKRVKTLREAIKAYKSAKHLYIEAETDEPNDINQIAQKMLDDYVNSDDSIIGSGIYNDGRKLDIYWNKNAPIKLRRKFLKSVTKLVVPDGITDIAEWVFANFEKLQSIELPDSLHDIYECAFENCKSLTSIKLPSKLNAFGKSAFRGSGLTELVMPDTMITVPEYCFDKCINLRKVVLSNNIEYIGGGAFGGCKSLTSIELPNTLEYIGSCAFGGTSIKEIRIPDSVTRLARDAFIDETDYETSCLEKMYVPKDKVEYYKEYMPSNIEILPY